MKNIKEILRQAAMEAGAQLFGVTDTGRLKGPACSDTNNLLMGTQSVLVFGVALDREIISAYLGKSDFSARDNMSRHEGECYHKLWSIGSRLAEMLREQGYQAVNAWPNKDYRDFRTGASRQSPFAMTPDFAHRFAAVAAGLGGFGWSSNVVTREYGAAVYFSSVLTNAVLEPDPLPDDNPCDNCGMCAQVCQAGFIQKGKETSETEIGGKIISHGRNGYLGRCALCCGGWVNQLQYPGWTTFSPLKAEFSFPESSEEFINEYRKMVGADLKGPESRAKRNILHHLNLTKKGMHETALDEYEVVCAFCQLVCWGDKKNRAKNVRIVHQSGIVTEDENGFEVIIRNGKVVDKHVEHLTNS